METTVNKKMLRDVVTAMSYLTAPDETVHLSADRVLTVWAHSALTGTRLTASINGTVSKPGNTHVTRADLQRALKGGTAKDTVSITAEGSDPVRLCSIPGSTVLVPLVTDPAILAELPIPTGEPLHWDRVDLADLIRITWPFISTEETRYYLNGAFIHPTGVDRVSAVATDGHRMVTHHVSMPYSDPAQWTEHGGSHGHGFIMHRSVAKALGLLIKATDPMSGVTMRMQPDGTEVQFTSAGIASFVLNFKSVEGVFPEYDRVIPNTKGKGYEQGEVFAAKQAAKALRDARPGQKDTIILNGTQAEIYESGAADAKTVLSGHVLHAGNRVAYRAQYLRDILSVFPSGRITMHTHAESPGVFVHHDLPDTLAVLMPVRT